MTYTHTCSCGAVYENDDPDPYFCAACIAQRKEIAASIDASRAAQPPEPKAMSGLEQFDAARKVHGFAIANDII